MLEGCEYMLSPKYYESKWWSALMKIINIEQESRDRVHWKVWLRGEHLVPCISVKLPANYSKNAQEWPVAWKYVMFTGTGYLLSCLWVSARRNTHKLAMKPLLMFTSFLNYATNLVCLSDKCQTLSVNHDAEILLMDMNMGISYWWTCSHCCWAKNKEEVFLNLHIPAWLDSISTCLSAGERRVPVLEIQMSLHSAWHCRAIVCRNNYDFSHIYVTYKLGVSMF